APGYGAGMPNSAGDTARGYGAGTPSPEGDTSRKFWVPLHKLFNGTEGIRGLDLTVTLTAHLFNQKLRKVHRGPAGQGFDTGWQEPALSQSPFIYSEYEGNPLAAFSTEPSDGRGLLVPVPRPRLVQLARDSDGRVVTLKVPKNRAFKSSLNINP